MNQISDGQMTGAQTDASESTAGTVPSTPASLSFDGRESEAVFIDEYRSGALQGALYAALSAALVYAAFLGVAVFSEQHTSLSTLVRSTLVVLLICVGAVIRTQPDFARTNYVPLTASASVLALGGAVLLLSFGPYGAPNAGLGASPALMFGLFLHYSFLRLPMWVAATIGWTVSTAQVIWGAPMVIGGNASARTLLYLAFVNIAGMIICRSFETRERELFHQRRRAEAAQAELDRRARAAEEAHMEKTRLMAAVSHDLRQPMMAAVHHVSLLERRLQKRDLDSAERQARALSDSVSVLAATLDHLLTAARYDSGTEPIMIESVELQPILARLRETFDSDAAARGIELRIRRPERRLVVTTDATAFWRVLMNLVSNAIKFTDPHGRAGRGVVVRATLRDGVCRIDVADTGIGIAPEYLNAIWQPYFQVANSERSRVRGLGLGLFLVRRALDHLPNHRMQLRSRPGRGSRFSVLLPGLELGEPEFLFRGHDRIADSDLEQLRGAYVLVLEDDVHARRALEDLLTDWSVLFTSCASLVELLEGIDSQERLVDFIISDYRLAGTATGTDAIVAIREALGAQIPAVIVTGESATAPIRERLPVDTAMLQKPFEATALAIPLLEAVRSARRAERM